jgi:glucose/arabinose dehydrogenase
MMTGESLQRGKMNPIHRNALLAPSRLLTLCALALAACAAPAVVPPTTAATQPPTATALPPTAAATAPAMPAPLNIPIPATSAALDIPESIAFDAAGNYYISNCGTLSQVYKIDPYGQLTVYAGSGGYGSSGDGGLARLADVSCPAGLAFGPDGNLYLSDPGGSRIRRIDRNGVITTVAGSGPVNGASGGFAGDGGPATAALLSGPSGLAFDAAGN